MSSSVAERSDAQIPIIFYTARVEGEGTICNVSSSGALIRDATASVHCGQRLTLELGLRSNLPSFRVAAEIVRQVEYGFAVRFFFEAPAESTLMRVLMDALASQREAVAAQAALRDVLEGHGPRSGPRVSPGAYPTTSGRVHFACGSRKGRGAVHDISPTGARVSKASLCPALGQDVEMLFLMGANRRPTRALARVAGHTESGFAVRFLNLERELEPLTLASTPKADPGSR